MLTTLNGIYEPVFEPSESVLPSATNLRRLFSEVHCSSDLRPLLSGRPQLRSLTIMNLYSIQLTTATGIQFPMLEELVMSFTAWNDHNPDVLVDFVEATKSRGLRNLEVFPLDHFSRRIHMPLGTKCKTWLLQLKTDLPNLEVVLLPKSWQSELEKAGLEFEVCIPQLLVSLKH